jgi:hypothetical protein
MPRCLVLSGGFTVIDREQRRLHDRAITHGFADLHGYLNARCQGDASLTQLASELGATMDVICRLLDQAGIERSPRPAPSASQRRRTTDQRLAAMVAELGFASLRAYLADRTRTRGWPSSQIATELGVHAATVRDRLDGACCHASGRSSGPLRRPGGSWCRRTRSQCPWRARVGSARAPRRSRHVMGRGGSGPLAISRDQVLAAQRPRPSF